MNILKKIVLIHLFFIFGFSLEFGEKYISSSQLRITEQKLLEFVNRERSAGGLKPLRYSKSLYLLAMDHNRKMSREGKLSHNFNGYPALEERMVNAGLYFSNAGENIAFSNVYPADFIHKGFVESPEHYENIMDPGFSEAGIAILETGRGFYVTQEFGTIISDISTNNMELMVLVLIKENGLFPDTGISEKIQSVYGKRLKRISEQVLLNPANIHKTGGITGFDMRAIVFNKKEQIREYLINSNTEGKYGSYGFAISSGRTEKYRGGAFSIVFLMKEKIAVSSQFIEQTERGLVELLNRRFESNPGVRFTYSIELSKKAAIAVERYYRGDKSLLSESQYNILAYQAVNPALVPEEYDGFFLANKMRNHIGIKILRPEENGIPLNYFLLAIVFEK